MGLDFPLKNVWQCLEMGIDVHALRVEMKIGFCWYLVAEARDAAEYFAVHRMALLAPQ